MFNMAFCVYKLFDMQDFPKQNCVGAALWQPIIAERHATITLKNRASLGAKTCGNEYVLIVVDDRDKVQPLCGKGLARKVAVAGGEGCSDILYA